jgi:phosphoribosylamine--glycine ligase
MKLLIAGSGAREHAFAWTLARRSNVELVCAPGNPGIAQVARCVAADPASPRDLLAVAAAEAVDLTVIGPELPLSRGVADLFAAQGRPLVGPTRQAAALEWSKVFAKEFMARHGIPTARFRVCASAGEARAALDRGELGYPVVLKAEGLAAGKGVIIAEDRASAEAGIEILMVERRFGAAADRVVIEEFLPGQEASYFVLADGAGCVAFPSAQDHKRIFDGDRGPNTGGMGAFAPSPLLTDPLEARVLDEIVRPVLAGMAHEGHAYRGFLYVGLMLTPDGPRVVEFNVRFGDPEAQVVLPMLDEDLAALLDAAARGDLPDRHARLRDEPHVGVVLASAGYPETSRSGDRIGGLDDASAVPNALVFHAATRREGDALVTDGGRVLTVVGHGPDFGAARGTAYRAAAAISFDGMQMRRDIANRVGTWKRHQV